ncbi:MAG: hypothetical protein A2487_00720 [Candidatus Raymondbacteria bacterium RifOxyC12_full_50_8]|uniref:Heme chaperone HemW n=1 Tax=Candidatus Raymondbacteria bacterium RIFOXYD12_FULL_49_13 TaxID=1817890 RepID=A0A1F7F9J3_UNCRA|nr:MAG: hypothetical protein A2350_03365 [Candidatus Raymondbacteria bacterium RifOxyB12_full_50_8]OGJ93273.1 MAG: hypothetical protein A2248_17940 [Candidatus Raymondbacteria bacterium RIFOXYA2_FULL_49_16]OGJ98175.1 MAG: hypothetical protein A2487_00720 [Candidatus Raymondbacteria bacterium RifOxyC12_full_50_8]OGK03354.1 MAG: hypothetical protein A2519_15285 [Candidatus Raymondbacteria bacterium RIFOXYD12_FULL_49_13]OGP44995.1 MAG: hypothetical protein A2324_19865 [Candidatus Raymondbacteria b
MSSDHYGLYIHVPFCARKCGYCDFYSTDAIALAPFFLRALKKQMAAGTPGFKRRPADTLYIGGGTPSLLAPEQIEKMVHMVRRYYAVASDAETTIECNPTSVTLEKAQAWKRAGINRVSLGAQSFNDDDLRFLNRLHTAADIFRAIELLAKAGFSNINLDLMFGMPGQTMARFKQNLTLALSLKVPHLSVYGLTVEQGTPLQERLDKGEFTRIHDEMFEAMFLTAHMMLSEKGYGHYEISNYARPGFESVHNLNCWRGTDYIGFGPAAHSRVGLQRWAGPDTVESFIANPLTRSFDHQVSDEEGRLEQIMLGLRTQEGISQSDLISAEKTSVLLRRGFAQQNLKRIRLTPHGMLCLDSIILFLEDKRCSTLNA